MQRGLKGFTLSPRLLSAPRRSRGNPTRHAEPKDELVSRILIGNRAKNNFCVLQPCFRGSAQAREPRTLPASLIKLSAMRPRNRRGFIDQVNKPSRVAISVALNRIHSTFLTYVACGYFALQGVCIFKTVGGATCPLAQLPLNPRRRQYTRGLCGS
jgi:hypothetical protein